MEDVIEAIGTLQNSLPQFQERLVRAYQMDISNMQRLSNLPHSSEEGKAQLINTSEGIPGSFTQLFTQVPQILLQLPPVTHSSPIVSGRGSLDAMSSSQ